MIILLIIHVYIPSLKIRKKKIAQSSAANLIPNSTKNKKKNEILKAKKVQIKKILKAKKVQIKKIIIMKKLKIMT
jgi:hypothetical protein